MIDQQVAEGRAPDATSLVEEAVLQLIDMARIEEGEIRAASEAGIADIEAGRYVVIKTSEDADKLFDRIMAEVRQQIASDDH